MNEELQKALTEIINKAIETTGTATDFMSAEIPEVVQQLLMWKMVESLVVFSVCVGLMIAIPVIVAKAFSYFKVVTKDTYNEGSEYMTLMGLLLLIFPFVGIDIDWLQIWIAPKVYLLEYVAGMVSK